MSEIVKEGVKNTTRQGNPLFDLVRMTWRFSEGNRKKLIFFLVLFVIAGTIDILVRPFAWSMIFDFIQKSGVTHESLPELKKLLIFLLLVAVVFWIFHGPARILERQNAYKARINYMQFLLRGVLALPMEWHSDHQSGDTIDKINKGGNALYNFSKDSFRVLYEVINLIGSVSVLAYFFPFSAVLMSCLMGFCVLIVVKFDKVLIAQYKQISKMQNVMSAGVFDAVSNITTVIILRVEQLVFNSVAHKAEKPLSINLLNNKLNELKWFLVNISVTSMVVLILGIYLYEQVDTPQGVSAGNFFLLYRYLDKVGGVFNSFAGMYGDIVQNRASVMNAEELSQHFSEEGLTNHVLPQDWKTISIRDLSFSYDRGKGGQHLNNINLEIPRGQKIAFVGESGCGKTTLMSLIRGLYKPETLELFVDDQKVPEGFDGIARGISLIPQSPEIFAGTVETNITLGAEHTQGTISKCCDMAMFSKVVRRLPKGMQSDINEKGVNLSGGQIQRLALARGLLASLDKSLILLDEPTSSLDAKTERLIYECIFREFTDTSIISSIHRLHLLPMFDVIYFFGKGGKILAVGGFDKLLTSCPEFTSLYRQYKGIGK